MVADHDSEGVAFRVSGEVVTAGTKPTRAAFAGLQAVRQAWRRRAAGLPLAGSAKEDDGFR